MRWNRSTTSDVTASDLTIRDVITPGRRRAPILGPVSIGTPTQVSAVQGVADQLRSAIHRGDLGAGDRLPPERERAQQLGVSRITLREAIRSLIDAGYLVARRGSRGGTFVTALEEPYRRWLAGMRADRSQLEDVIEFRMAVERRAARLADNLFHRAVAAASRSTRLIEAIDAARGELFLQTDRIIYTELVDEALDQHRRILGAIVAGDEDGAAAAVEAHIEATRTGLRTLLGG